MQRKQIYKNKINQFLKKLSSFQDNKGCFFYPAKKDNINYYNARWQEAVYTLALTNQPKEKIIKGIDFWCKLQNRGGSLPEYCKTDKSFSATAFTLNAVVSAIEIIGLNPTWKKHIIKAGDWLVKNKEIILTNQQSVATLALLKLSILLKSKKYYRAAENNLTNILKSQKGYYPEKKGFDLGYSTLTIDNLAQYYQITKDKRIIKSVEDFCKTILNNRAKNKVIKNTRSKTNWVIINGFEILAPKSKIIKETLKIFLQNYDFIHIVNNRHVATDLYRIILAHKNAKVKLGKLNYFDDFEKRKEEKPKILLNPIRFLGLHKLRRILYKLK